MTRVAFVHPSAELYGSDRVLLDHLLHLDRARFEPRVYLPRRGPLCERLTRAEVPWELAEVAGITRPERTVSGLWRVLRAAQAWPARLERAGAELVHTSTLACLGGALGAKRLGLPHLWHVQEIPPLWAQRALAPLLHAAGGLRVANSQAVAAWLAARGLSAEVVYPGRAPALPSAEQGEEGRAALRRALGVPPDACLGVVLGRLSPRKGQALALAALEAADSAELWLVLAGDEAPGHAGYRADLRARIARSSRWDRVRLLPAQSEPWPLLAASDLVLVPSQDPESFGLVALEGLLAGRPVLASSLGGLPEALGGKGELLQLDPASWARAWLDVAKDPERHRARAAEGRAHARAFTPERMSLALQGCYARLLG